MPSEPEQRHFSHHEMALEQARQSKVDAQYSSEQRRLDRLCTAFMIVMLIVMLAGGVGLAWLMSP